MKRSDLIRQCLFFNYTVTPFRASMVWHHALSRLKSRVMGRQGFRVMDLAVTYDCNLSCDHCSSLVLKREAPPLSLDDYAAIVRQGRELDNLSWNITGGEPLLCDFLDDLIPVLNPSRHYISIQTNGLLLTYERARRLAMRGVNCITTSLDSADRAAHNRFRGHPKAYDRVLSAVDNARRAGMKVLVGGTVTHDNLYSKDLEDLIRLVNTMGAIFLFNLAVPCGNWAHQDSMLLRGNDRKRLTELLGIYPATSTDHEPGRNAKGCPAAMEKIYITPYGDVLPCPFIHVSYGQVKEELLKGIINRMRTNAFYKGYPKTCVAAEDRVFQQQVLSRLQDGRRTLPVDYRDVENTDFM